MAQKPLAARILEQRRIPHELVQFDPGIRTASGVAQATGRNLDEVYKTLVVEHYPPKAKPMLVLLPAGSELDLKALAAAIGAKKLRMASQAAAERYTGLKVGGISPLALLNRGFEVYIDGRARAHSHLLVSAGERGFDVRLAVLDLLALTQAKPLSGIAAPA